MSWSFSLLAQLYEAVLIEELPDRRLSVDDLKHWHHASGWAMFIRRPGLDRSINMPSKGRVSVCCGSSGATTAGRI